MRSRFVLLGLGLVLGILVAATGASGVLSGQRRGHIVRWDLPQIVQGTAVAGGEDVAQDANTGDTVTLTGSGHAKPAAGKAYGGGTFVHRHADGTEVAHGVYLVTGFISWQKNAGTFPAPQDGIGKITQAHAGILKLDVQIQPEGGAPLNGVLTVFCHFPDTPQDYDEGVAVSVGPYNFTQAGGVTLFHVFR